MAVDPVAANQQVRTMAVDPVAANQQVRTMAVDPVAANQQVRTTAVDPVAANQHLRTTAVDPSLHYRENPLFIGIRDIIGCPHGGAVAVPSGALVALAAVSLLALESSSQSSPVQTQGFTSVPVYESLQCLNISIRHAIGTLCFIVYNGYFTILPMNMN